MATTKVGIAPMKVVQISKPGGDFEIVEREIPNPGAREVRIKVQACGVCDSDTGQTERCRSSAAAVRGSHHLQRLATQRRVAGQSCCGARRRRPRPPRNPICE